MRVVPETSSSPKTILMLRLSSIGDVVLTTPAMEFIKTCKPEVRLVLLTKKAFAPMYENHPFLDEVIEFEEFGRNLWDKLYAINPSAILDLHNNLRTFRIKCRFWNIPSFSINKKSWQRWLLVKKWSKTPVESVAVRNIKTAQRALQSSVFDFENCSNEDWPGMSLYRFEQKFPRHEFSEIRGMADGEFAVMHISATYNTKRVSFKIWEHVLKNRQESWVITGGAEDLHHAEALVELVNQEVNSKFPVINLVGKTSLQQTSAIIERAVLFLGGDTGFTHVAAAYMVPHMVIWGNTSPDLGFVPWLGSEADDSLQLHLRVEGLSCNPCSKLGYSSCPSGHFSCMNLQNMQELEMKLQILRDRNK